MHVVSTTWKAGPGEHLGPGVWRLSWTTEEDLILDQAKTEVKQNPRKGGRHQWKRRDKGKAVFAQAMMMKRISWWPAVMSE